MVWAFCLFLLCNPLFSFCIHWFAFSDEPSWCFGPGQTACDQLGGSGQPANHIPGRRGGGGGGRADLPLLAAQLQPPLRLHVPRPQHPLPPLAPQAEDEGGDGGPDEGAAQQEVPNPAENFGEEIVPPFQDTLTGGTFKRYIQ